jgi:hypothetical protein
MHMLLKRQQLDPDEGLACYWPKCVFHESGGIANGTLA